MILKPCLWNIIPGSFVQHALVLNEPYKVTLYPYWQQLQINYYCQLKCSDSGYILELSPTEENKYPSCPHIPITLMTWYDTRFSFKSSHSYTLLLEHENEVDSEESPHVYSALLR